MQSCFHLLSFEGPDHYSMAGGIGSRVTGLAAALAEMGCETHLWFVGDPLLPGYEIERNLRAHRWCQWLSRHFPAGVYDGQDAKVEEYARSLPPILLRELKSSIASGVVPVVLAEEWHTVPALLHLHELLVDARLRDRVRILWNANNTFGFSGIDWIALQRAACITTVSRYMAQIMRPLGVEAVVIPNGLGPEAFVGVPDDEAQKFRALASDRTILTKVARFDPDKRWLAAIAIISELKKEGLRPLLIARGGIEAHGHDVLAEARDCGLRVREVEQGEAIDSPLAEILHDSAATDVLHIRSHLDWSSRRLLYQESATVLANSAHEPFGLVGLEAMAAGGVACTGCSGEDYAIPGHNAIVLQTEQPAEFVSMFTQLREQTSDERALRTAGRETARHFAWPAVIRRALMPRVAMTWRRGMSPAMP